MSDGAAGDGTDAANKAADAGDAAEASAVAEEAAEVRTRLNNIELGSVRKED